MSKYYLLVFSFLLFPFFSFSQPDYNVDNIPKELKESAGSVVRLDERTLEVKSPAKAELNAKFAITILHESHRSNAIFRQTYDDFTKLSSIKIAIYDGRGKKLHNISKKDIIDMTNFSESALYASIRQKVYKPDYYEYPFTIEYSYTETYNGILSFPTYACITDYDMSLEKGSFTIKTTEDIIYQEYNFNTEPDINVEDGQKVYKWEFKNLKPIRNEDYDLSLYYLVPIIRSAPKNFEMEGYSGTCDSWRTFGNWIYNLNSGRDILSSKTVNEVQELTKNLNTKREKTKAVYEYMQARTRYVNITIGIGGWQPFPALDVDNNGYGDCKALSNYTYSLLKAVGVESYYAIIRAGANSREIIKDFPTNQFNHAIVCVPDDNDTIWLECTSQRNAFDYLGTFTDGRYALIIKSNDSKLVRTPKLTANENYRNRNATIKIDNDGNVHADISKKYGGIYYDNVVYLTYLEGKRRMDRVRDRIHIKNFTLSDADYRIEELKSSSPYVKEDYPVYAKKYVQKLGNRLLFSVNFFNTIIDVPSSINKQESDIYMGHSLIKTDSLEFIVPDGYYIKSFPDNYTVKSEFVEFYTNYSLDGNTLKYVRKQIIKEGIYEANKYDELRSYLKKISTADKSKVLLMPEE